MTSVSNKIKPHAHKGVIYSYIVYDIKLFKYIYDDDPMLGRSLSGSVNLIHVELFHFLVAILVKAL